MPTKAKPPSKLPTITLLIFFIKKVILPTFDLPATSQIHRPFFSACPPSLFLLYFFRSLSLHVVE